MIRSFLLAQVTQDTLGLAPQRLAQLQRLPDLEVERQAAQAPGEPVQVVGAGAQQRTAIDLGEQTEGSPSTATTCSLAARIRISTG